MQHLQSLFLGGFEPSSHRRADKRRLDLIAATGRDRCATRDDEMMAVAAARTIRQALPEARFISSEPLIGVVAASEVSQAEARPYHAGQYEAVDMLLGRRWPELRGSPERLERVLGAAR